MHLETTVYLDVATIGRIQEMADERGITFSKMVSILLHNFGTKRWKKTKSFCRVKYQKQNPEIARRIKHIVLRKDEYEFGLDLRKLFKLSISYIIAISVDYFLKNSDTDNYPYKDYAMVSFKSNNIQCWLFCWGVPENLPPEILK